MGKRGPDISPPGSPLDLVSLLLLTLNSLLVYDCAATISSLTLTEVDSNWRYGIAIDRTL